MAKKELLKLNNIRLKNTLAALNTLRTDGQLSRVELAKKMNCDGTAVTRITRNLIDKGILKTAGMLKSQGGRPRESIELNADWKQAIGIELTPGYITGVLTNLKGRVIVREQIFLSREQSREELTRGLRLLTGRLLNSCEQNKLLGIGIATFGAFSGENKVLDEVISYPALEKFNIRKFFREEFGITPEIADATFARAQYEIWFKNAGSNGNVLLFNVGAGIGCATAIDGKIVFERHSNTGEFGHTIYKIDGEICACGRRGCLETLCSTSIIEKMAREKKPGINLSFSSLASKYAGGDREFESIINTCAKWMGIAIANQVNFLMPNEVVLTGEMLQLGDEFFKNLLNTAEEYIFSAFMKNLRIRKSDCWEESASLGAASLLIKKIFEDTVYID